MSLTDHPLQPSTIELDLDDRTALENCISDEKVTVVILDESIGVEEIELKVLQHNGIESEEEDIMENGKDYLKSMSTASTTIVCDESDNDEEEKENISLLPENKNTSVKSASTNFVTIFPDAPTTPKVCRKAPYDENVEVKDIVKKYNYDSSTAEKSQTNNNPDKILIEENFCCSTYSATTCNSLDCLVCNPENNHMHTKKSIEIDKGIIC